MPLVAKEHRRIILPAPPIRDVHKSCLASASPPSSPFLCTSLHTMSHYYPNPKYPYSSGPSYAPCFLTAPMNYTYEYSSSGDSESSSSAYTADSSNHSGCLSAALPSDLPDLYYDQYELPSPPSATSSNMISTPPLDWAQPWVSIETKPASYQQEPWQSSPLVSERPMVHPTDTHCNWIYQQQQSGALEPSSILFSSYQQPHTYSSSLLSSSSHALQTQFVSPGAALSSSAPLSVSATTTVSPSALTLHPAVSPPHPAPVTSQVSLKLHQPRPSRRIPIVSLSKLAMACDDFRINPQPKAPKETPSAQVNLPFGTNPSKPYHPMAYHSSNQFINQSIHPKNDIYGTPFPSGATNNTCGCMTPYACH
jgi:hypothetical protein